MSNADAPLIVNLPGFLQDSLDGRHPSTRQVAQYFGFGHLPQHLASVSYEFVELAGWLLDVLPDSPELTVTLRKLLESKDAAVRAAVAHHAATNINEENN